MSGRGERTVRLGAEFGVIVIGVLVALVGEAWWQGRQEAEQEGENLAVLADDLLSADATLSRVIREDSTFAAQLALDLEAMAAGDTTHTLRLALAVSDYRLRTGGLNRALAEPGPVLEDAADLLALLSDLQAEIRLVERLNGTMTAELFRYVQGVVEIQAELERADDDLTRGELLEGLGESPRAVADITMVTVILQNRDGLHRRLRQMVQEARRALARRGTGRAPEADSDLRSPAADSGAGV